MSKFQVVKAPTKSERLLERQLTPTPPSSDNEDSEFQRRRRDRGEKKVDKRRISSDKKETKEVRQLESIIPFKC